MKETLENQAKQKSVEEAEKLALSPISNRIEEMANRLGTTGKNILALSGVVAFPIKGPVAYFIFRLAENPEIRKLAMDAAKVGISDRALISALVASDFLQDE